MTAITRLDDLLSGLKGAAPRRLAVAAGHDPNTLEAAMRAAAEGIALVTLVADKRRLDEMAAMLGPLPEGVTVIDEADPSIAAARAVALVRSGQADVLMKGLVATSDYMKRILDRELGLLPPGRVLSHVTVLELPRLPRLLFVADVAIIPQPDVAAKLQIIEYCLHAARSFGIARPRVALVTATEKVSAKMPATVEADEIRRLALDGRFGDAIVDGPLALDVAISPEACRIKELDSPVGGLADILVFPNIETGNVFYKSATLLAGARVAAAVVGTTAPCVLTSRADDEESKLLSIALGCRLAG
ncbi:MAG: phosphate butyryltransferase [bacterium]|nr:phosphate butyryltransferase [bacterium]